MHAVEGEMLCASTLPSKVRFIAAKTLVLICSIGAD